MESLVSLFAVGFGLTSLFLWFSFFRMIRKNLGDPESKRLTAVRALVMLAVAFSLQLLAKQLPRIDVPILPYQGDDLVVFVTGIAIWAAAGMIININVVKNNHAETLFQKKVDLFTVVAMISSSIWAIIPYIGFVFLPSLGLALDHSLIVTAVISGVYALYQLIED